MQNVLIFDIETSPNLAYVWAKYEQNVLAFEKERELICFAYKWLGQKSVKAHSINEMTEKELVTQLHDLFDKADIVIAHNGDNFDIKMANAFFIKQGLNPPSPYKSIDTLKIARSKFKFNSNKLNDLGDYLELGQKVETGGFKLWLDCLKGDQKAWAKMIKYNKQDVTLLEAVYNKLSPWGKTPPINRGMNCPNCNSDNLQKRGWNINLVSMSQRFQCMSCGKWCSSNRKIKHQHKEYLKQNV